MKPPKITPELRTATKMMLAAKVARQVVEPIVLANQAKVLADYIFEVDERWAPHETGRITKPQDAWLMTEANFLAYLGSVNQLNIAAGYQYPSESCPLLMAQEDERIARRQMIDAAKYITGFGYEDIIMLEDYQKAEDLTIGLVLALTDIPKAEIIAAAATYAKHYHPTTIGEYQAQNG